MYGRCIQLLAPLKMMNLIIALISNIRNREKSFNKISYKVSKENFVM